MFPIQATRTFRTGQFLQEFLLRAGTRRPQGPRHEFLSSAPRDGPPDLSADLSAEASAEAEALAEAEGGHYVLASPKTCATSSSVLRHVTVRLKADITYCKSEDLRHEFLSPAPRDGPPEGGHYVLLRTLRALRPLS